MKTSALDEQKTAVLTRMENIDVNSEEYQTMLTLLERLNDVQAKERRTPASRDTIILVVGNILVALVVVAYEQKHVWTSRATSQTINPRDLK